jgi:hypothetical protein
MSPARRLSVFAAVCASARVSVRGAANAAVTHVPTDAIAKTALIVTGHIAEALM